MPWATFIGTKKDRISRCRSLNFKTSGQRRVVVGRASRRERFSQSCRKCRREAICQRRPRYFFARSSLGTAGVVISSTLYASFAHLCSSPCLFGMSRTLESALGWGQFCTLKSQILACIHKILPSTIGQTTKK